MRSSIKTFDEESSASALLKHKPGNFQHKSENFSNKSRKNQTRCQKTNEIAARDLLISAKRL